MGMENADKVDSMKTQQGIGLYKIRYEMDVKNSSRDQSYMAGVLAYTSKEAVDSLIIFAKARVKGFKGMKVEEVAFEGACHALSDSVKEAVLKTAVLEGKAVTIENYEAVVKEAKALAKKTKKSIIPNKEKE